MRVAVISGYGFLPVLSVKALKEAGAYVAAFVINEGCNHPLCLENFSDTAYKVSAGQVGKILKLIKKERLTHALLIGKVEINLLESGLRFDLTALRLLAGLKFRSTDTISMVVVRELEKRGLKMLSQKDILKRYMPDACVFSARKPNEKEEAAIKLGFEAAKAIGRIDVGQSVVIESDSGKITALESAEGTDKTFARGCLLSAGKGVAVKVAKPFQDSRFDLPVVGTDTLKSVAENGGQALAFEAGETIVADIDACIEYANLKNIIFAGVKG